MKFKEKINKLPVHIKITITHILILLMIEIIFYPLIPFLLNYPPDSINNAFQIQVAGLKYSTQYIGLSAIIIVGAAIMLYRTLRKTNYSNLRKENRKNIRKICMEYPYKIYLYEMLIPSVLVLLALVLIRTELILAIRIMIIFLSAITALCITALIVSKVMYEKMLADTYDENVDIEPEGKRRGLTFSTVLQIFPIFVFSILITSLIGYSRIIVEKGDMLFEINKIEIQELISKIGNMSIDDIKNLYENETNVFLIKHDGTRVLGAEDISEFFKQYLLQISDKYGGRVYEYYGSNIQAVSDKVIIDGEEYLIGIRYPVTSNGTIIYFLVVFLILIIFNFFASWSISHTISYEIEKVSERLRQIAQQDNIENTAKLPITSNNEISDLVGSFNMILDLEKAQIQQIKQSQETMMEQERLVTLGQLAGGMAHDINTPLSSISTGVDYFAKHIEKDENTEMMIEAVRKSIGKISAIVNSVRDQIRNFGSEKIERFELGKVVENVDALLFTELKKTNCKMEIESLDEIYLEGDRGKLEQVLTNIVLNAVQAYESRGGIIKVKTYMKDSNAIIEVEDNAGGIPAKIAEDLLSQIVSTKGSRGTGFGLYFSNSIIKGVFKGEIKFETEEGNGTTFYIVLPI